MNLIQRALYSPLNVQMVVTRRCNLSCAYCNEYDHTSPPVSLGQLKRQINKLNELGAFSVVLSGGEPLLHPNTPDLIRYARRYISRVGMITNGFMLTKERILELNDADLDAVQISIDGVHPRKATIKVLECLEDRLILLKHHARFKVYIHAVIGSTDPKEALQVVRCSNRLGFRSTVGLIHDGHGQICLDESERQAYLLANRLRRKPWWDRGDSEEALMEQGDHPFKCRAGSRYLYIDEFGDVQWCSQKRGVFHKPLMIYSFEDLKTQFYESKKCSRQCTICCVREASFLDGLRKQNGRTNGYPHTLHSIPQPLRTHWRMER